MEILGAQYLRQTLFRDRFSKLFMLESNSWPPTIPLLSGWNYSHSSVFLQGPSSASHRGEHHSGVTSSSPFLRLFCLPVILWVVFFHPYPWSHFSQLCRHLGLGKEWNYFILRTASLFGAPCPSEKNLCCRAAMWCMSFTWCTFSGWKQPLNSLHWQLLRTGEQMLLVLAWSLSFTLFFHSVSPDPEIPMFFYFPL